MTKRKCGNPEYPLSENVISCDKSNGHDLCKIMTGDTKIGGPSTAK